MTVKFGIWQRNNSSFSHCEEQLQLNVSISRTAYTVLLCTKRISAVTSDVFHVPIFSEIYVPIFCKLLLKYFVVTNLTVIHVNYIVNNYYILTFILEETSLMTGI